jgi:tetratricopeptide (TPR) repeat protein
MLKDDPHDSFLNYALALEHGKIGDISKAIEIIESLLIKDINYLGAYYQLGKYYEELQQPLKALDAYQKGAAIAKQQNNRKTLGELNSAIMQLEDMDE